MSRIPSFEGLIPLQDILLRLFSLQSSIDDIFNVTQRSQQGTQSLQITENPGIEGKWLAVKLNVLLNKKKCKA